MSAINPVTDLSRDGDIAVITLNSPPVNALSETMREGLIAALREAESDAAVKATLLICAGRTFIAGADISEFDKVQTRRLPARCAERHGRGEKAYRGGDPRHRAGRRIGNRDVRALPGGGALRQTGPAGSRAGPGPGRGRHAAPAAPDRRRKGAGDGDGRQADLRDRRPGAGTAGRADAGRRN